MENKKKDRTGIVELVTLIIVLGLCCALTVVGTVTFCNIMSFFGSNTC